ncbi:SPG7 matrix AAA peptidase subunit, paraplegin [Colletes latitarsis]|uniref:SPG7 matrix AAA peptidase subunit, paraplegin n=1 Tax=Colletes latitarsis TaxID=2605962 RepID=UPI004036611D
MQNLIKYPKRQYVDSRRYLVSFLKYNSKNTISRCINLNNDASRLCLPATHRLYLKVHQELNAIQSLLFKNDPRRRYCFTTLYSTRNFSTTPRLSNKNINNGGASKGPNRNPNDPNEFIVILLKLFLIISVFILSYQLTNTEMINSMQIHKFIWNDFINEMLLKGEVEQIVIDDFIITVYLRPDAIYKGQRYPRRYFRVNSAEYAKILEDKIREVEKSVGIKAEDAVPIKYIHKKNNDGSIVTSLLLLGLLYMIFRGKSFRNMGMKFPDPKDFMNQKTKASFTLVEPFSGKGVRFEDVAGLKEAKTEIMEFVDYLKQPDRYKKLGAKVPKGALLLGPPGCGKTLIAKAVATESNVPFLSMNGSEFIEMLGGLGAARVRDLFAEAKKRAPSIIYIDEIDAVGKKRSEGNIDLSNDESERTLNQLLAEMDGMTSSEDVIIFASTNREDVLDKALIRPGRFDRHILIDLPTMEERKQIFEYHLKSLSLQGKPDQYSGYLASLTPGFSGADIANVCNEAALHAVREKKTKVRSDDLLYAIDRNIGGATKKTNTLTPSTKKVVAYHEAGHALVGWLLEYTDTLLKVTIVPRTNLSLGFAQYTLSDQKLYNKQELFQRICMMLGGRVAESITFNQISTGAENDLKKITQIAYDQVQRYGMSPTVGLISFDEEMTSTKTKKLYSKKMGNLMDAEVQRIITEAYKTTEKLLLDNKDKLKKLAEALLERETLTYDDVEKLLGPPPFGKKRLIDPIKFVPDIETEAPKPTHYSPF